MHQQIVGVNCMGGKCFELYSFLLCIITENLRVAVPFEATPTSTKKMPGFFTTPNSKLVCVPDSGKLSSRLKKPRTEEEGKLPVSTTSIQCKMFMLTGTSWFLTHSRGILKGHASNRETAFICRGCCIGLSDGIANTVELSVASLAVSLEM